MKVCRQVWCAAPASVCRKAWRIAAVDGRIRGQIEAGQRGRNPRINCSLFGVTLKKSSMSQRKNGS
jgi:hypothetical protein